MFSSKISLIIAMQALPAWLSQYKTRFGDKQANDVILQTLTSDQKMLGIASPAAIARHVINNSDLSLW